MPVANSLKYATNTDNKSSKLTSLLPAQIQANNGYWDSPQMIMLLGPLATGSSWKYCWCSASAGWSVRKGCCSTSTSTSTSVTGTVRIYCCCILAGGQSGNTAFSSWRTILTPLSSHKKWYNRESMTNI